VPFPGVCPLRAIPIIPCKDCGRERVCGNPPGFPHQLAAEGERLVPAAASAKKLSAAEPSFLAPAVAAFGLILGNRVTFVTYV
jgi:hypothetical protein